MSTAPPSTSLWPPRNFVELWMTRSAPSSSGRCSTGLAKVLSTATIAPAPCTSSLTASRSTMRSSGLVGDSSHTNRVRSVIAAAIASRSVGSTDGEGDAVAAEDLVEEPEGAAVHILGEDHVVPGVEQQHHRRGRGQAGREGETVLRVLERREALLEVVPRVGLPEREYSNPLCRPGDSCAKVVARWIGTTTAPVDGSGPCPTCRARVARPCLRCSTLISCVRAGRRTRAGRFG